MQKSDPEQIESQILNLRKTVKIVETQRKLAKALKVTPQSVNSWCKGLQVIPLEQALKIHILTKGKVTAYGLRPDLDILSSIKIL